MQNSGNRRIRIEDESTSNANGGPLLDAPTYAQDRQGTTNSTRSPPQYQSSGGPSANNGLPNTSVSSVRSIDANSVYFYTESYPFAAEQFDTLREDQPTQNAEPHQLPGGGKDVPVINANSFKLLKLDENAPSASTFQRWDELCLKKHLGAVRESMATPEELDAFLLGDNEGPLHVLRLAGVSDAPGLHQDVAQRCRMTFTTKDRLIFAQNINQRGLLAYILRCLEDPERLYRTYRRHTHHSEKHSAEVGIPSMNWFNSYVLPCFHDKWSRRTWTSYYASIHASDILQVFVQQRLTTDYHSFGCACHDICSDFCIVGGFMQTDKDIEGAMRSLGDFDPEGIVKEHEKTRRMRHALVVRYVDCATNSVRQTVAYAHPDTTASDLYKIARSIEGKITLRSTEWFKFKSIPTPLAANAFHDRVTTKPFLTRPSYKIALVVLFIVALVIFIVNASAALAMIFSVFLSYGGGYYDFIKTVNTGVSAAKSLFASQSLAGLIYIISLFSVISQSS